MITIGETANMMNFNPLSPHGERRGDAVFHAKLDQFQSTLPAWGETGGKPLFLIHNRFQSTLPAWGETLSSLMLATFSKRFQSTLPAWGETQWAHPWAVPSPISIHSPRMGRDNRSAGLGQRLCISIHSPRMGRDSGSPNSRSDISISIHSPRMGRDGMPAEIWPGLWNFNPLSPHGERPRRACGTRCAEEFQSTLPAWGETVSPVLFHALTLNFNPLSPHGERPASARRASTVRTDFNPLSPHGERLPLSIRESMDCYFNPLSPHGERPTGLITPEKLAELFQSTLPAWGETLHHWFWS